MNSEAVNENKFKSIAMTFSLESNSKDIQDILQKKMNYNIKVIKELNGIIGSLSSSKDSFFKRSLIKDSKIRDFILEAYNEYKLIIGCTNGLLAELLKKNNFIEQEMSTNNHDT